MTRPLLLLAATGIAAAVATAACSGGSAGDGATPTPTPTATGTLTPTPTPGGPATIRVLVECSNGGCIAGRLRTWLFDCTSGIAVVMRTDYGVALVAGTPFIADLHVEAPISGCAQASVDDTNGASAISSGVPHVSAAIGETNGTALVVDTFAN